jgi:hypothetical protein
VEGFAGSLSRSHADSEGPARLERRVQRQSYLLKGRCGVPLFKVVQKQLLLEIVRSVFGRLKMIATFPRKLTQQSFLIFPGKSGNNNGTGRSESI